MEDTPGTRKVMSIIGLFMALVTVGPSCYAIDNLHGHTTRAAVYLAIFIFGMIIAWVSVMNPLYQNPTAKEQKQAEVEAKKQEEKGDKTIFWLGIAVLGMALFFIIIGSKFIFSSIGYVILWIVMIISGIVMIIFSRPKKLGQGFSGFRGTFSRTSNNISSRTSNKSSAKVSSNQSGKKSGFAIASLILGITSLIPLIGLVTGALAVVFGFISLGQISKEGLSGKGMAIAGIVLGFTGIFLTFISLFSFIFGARSAVG